MLNIHETTLCANFIFLLLSIGLIWVLKDSPSKYLFLYFYRSVFSTKAFKSPQKCCTVFFPSKCILACIWCKETNKIYMISHFSLTHKRVHEKLGYVIQSNLQKKPPPMTGHLFYKATFQRMVCVDSY